MEDYIIAFDVGGTQMKYGLVTLKGDLEEPGKIPSQSNLGAEKLLSRIVECIEKIRSSHSGKLVGVGLGLSGGVQPDRGVVRLPGKFKALEGYPIVQDLRNRYVIPVYAGNDGHLAAYAERYFGQAKAVDWAVVITIGTGVGSGVILDGKILSDPHFMFGMQIGHLIMDKSDDRTCLTGNAGTGEIFCSATALALQVRSAIQRGIPSMLSDGFYENPFHIDFRKVLAACREGDGLCNKELEVWVRNVSVMLINAVHCYSPQVIILSGGAMLGADLFIDRLRRMVNEAIFSYPVDREVKIVVSDMGQYAGIMGAAAMVMEKLKR